jgi:hypothetical protein
MSGTTKDTIQKILLIALGALTVSMISISFLNNNESRQKNKYLDHEKALVQEELEEIIKNYDHLAALHADQSAEVFTEKEKAVKLLDELQHTILDYESILTYRREMLELRKYNHRMQRKFHTNLEVDSINPKF